MTSSEAQIEEHFSWIGDLIAEAESYVTPAAPPAPKPRIRPTVVTQGPNTYATYIGADGLASYVTIDGPGWKL